MSHSLYALLVGINEYPAPVRRLKGCINDVSAFDAFLDARCATQSFTYHSKTLLDSDATRQVVIDQFQQHLIAQAGPEDVALFYYSGHGSQAPAPVEFWPFEPDHKNETLVLYDSRQTGSWDLADKELAYLIEKLSATRAHVLIILDCCHAGSGTREAWEETNSRWQAPDERLRPAGSFLFETSYLGTRSLEKTSPGSGWAVLPQGRHVLLAACRDTQTAKEYFADEKSWGAFSYFLRTALERYKGELTYYQVFQHALARVSASIFDQTPQLEAGETDDIHLRFLGGALQPKPVAFTVSYQQGVWQINAGEVSGLPHPHGSETTHLAIYPLGGTAAQMLGNATLKMVQLAVSTIELQAGLILDTTQTYEALITQISLPRLPVSLAGDDNGLALIREMLEKSLYIHETQAKGTLRLSARSGQYEISRPVDNRSLVNIPPGYTVEIAQQVVQNLEHIARWTHTLELEHPDSLIPTNQVYLTVIKDGQELDSGELLMEYTNQDGVWKKPEFRLRIENRFDRPLYCAVLGLWESFGIDAKFLAGGGEWVKPGPENAVLSRQMFASVPEALWKTGVTERRDVIKLIAATTDFQPILLTQNRLDAPSIRSADAEDIVPKGALERLFNRIQTRESDDTPEGESRDDWLSKQIVMTVRRPLPSTLVPSDGKPLDLGHGVKVVPHPAIQAHIRLTSAVQAERGLGVAPLPPILNDSQALYFNHSRGGDPGLSVIELSQLSNREVVTPKQPLQFVVEQSLPNDEQWLPVAYDGEFYLPLGRAVPQGSKTEILIERLPEPVSDGSRDLFGAIRIYIQKIGHRVFPNLPYPYPVLAIAEVDDDRSVTYTSYSNQVELIAFQKRVAQAETITLFVHGIIGETRTMVHTARQYLKDDLILAFDYENINTPIENVARSLKQRLTEVGLKPGHGKNLRIVGHSLGGLIARWLIEYEGGNNKMVNHLVILGSPSIGSPISTVEDWAIMLIGLAINHLLPSNWPLEALGGLLQLIENIDITLDQVKPDSDFLKKLASAPDPGVPYTLIAGNTSILSEALASNNDGQDSRAGRFLAHMGYSAWTLALFRQPNDIAVSVSSVFALPAGRTPEPEKVPPVACDHTQYFSSSGSLEQLARVLADSSVPSN